MKQSIILFIITTISLYSCHTKPELTNTYIGSYRIWDQNIPYPYILNITNNSIQYIDNKGSIIGETDRKDHTISTGDTIYFQDNTLCISHSKKQKLSIIDLKDSLNFPVNKKDHMPYFYSAIFKQLYTTTSISLEELRSKLIGKTWEIDQKHKTPNNDLDIQNTLHFTTNHLSHLITYSYKETQIFSEYKKVKFHLFEVDGLIFISLDDGKDNPLTILQITKIEGNTITWKNFRSRETEEEQLIISTLKEADFFSKTAESTEYAHCFDGLIAEYYYEDINYIHGNEYLKNKIKQNAPKSNLILDGYITIHFDINCKGQIGRIGMEQMDRNYKPIQFEKPLVSHIVKEVTKLKDWPLSYGHFRGTDYNDVHGFLMFKIKDGLIVDVSP